MPSNRNRSTKALVAVVGAIGTLADLTPTSQLERLKVRRIVMAALNLPKEAIVSRESGVIDITVAKTMFTPAQLQRAVEQAGATNGIQITVTSPATLEGDIVKLSFTNDLMQAQAQWGARGNSRQGRVLAAQPPAVPAPAPTNSAPAKSQRKGGARRARKQTA